MTQYINRHEELNKVMHYMQPPSRRGEDALNADWKMRNDGMNDYSFRNCIINGLPDSMQTAACRHVASDKDITTIPCVEFQDISFLRSKKMTALSERNFLSVRARKPPNVRPIRPRTKLKTGPKRQRV